MHNDLAKIHIAKQALGLDDATYRAMLQRIGGVDSSAQLDPVGRRALLAEFRAAGWKPTPGKAANARALASDPQSRMIRALWLRLHQAGKVRDPSEKSLAQYVKRQTRIDRLDWLSAAQARRVIEALKGWAARVGVTLEDA
ncbi:gp16 family protein [Thiocystis violascens]|uniref:Mu-like prophage protein gp16 n=1 Tax=Thiocystis violascens (strain ATCC 17096 / DSM 198 / 6111) TaxID=765911 RepID=I3YGT8_THIV6|nr:phage protein GemA/Gp16 family protein [Thiocystis violascens]AFL76206.1 Mu-like prophage protein gp16 [Thiocystis violascens DSM 198]